MDREVEHPVDEAVQTVAFLPDDRQVLRGADRTPRRRSGARSGGLQFDWGAHLVDYALNFLGTDVRAVAGFAWRSPGKPADQVDDHAVAHLYFKSGAVAHITSRGKAFDNDAGWRIDPPVSVPMASGASNEAIAADEPPPDPPGMRSRSHGLRVGP